MSKTIVFVTHFLGVLALCSALAYAGDKETALKELKENVFNFDEVGSGIYRSGLIFEEHAPLLKKLGVKTVINFHNDAKLAAREREFLKLYGIDSIWLPWVGVDSPPEDIMEKSLKLLDAPEAKPILVHCQRGAERTGVTIAAWRVTREKWPAARAYEEMKAHKFRFFRYGHLKKYLYDLAYKQGDQEARIDNVFERAKTSTLSSIYQLRKLNPFCRVQPDKALEN